MHTHNNKYRIYKYTHIQYTHNIQNYRIYKYTYILIYKKYPKVFPNKFFTFLSRKMSYRAFLPGGATILEQPAELCIFCAGCDGGQLWPEFA